MRLLLCGTFLQPPSPSTAAAQTSQVQCDQKQPAQGGLSKLLPQPHPRSTFCHVYFRAVPAWSATTPPPLPGTHARTGQRPTDTRFAQPPHVPNTSRSMPLLLVDGRGLVEAHGRQYAWFVSAESEGEAGGPARVWVVRGLRHMHGMHMAHGPNRAHACMHGSPDFQLGTTPTCKTAAAPAAVACMIASQAHETALPPAPPAHPHAYARHPCAHVPMRPGPPPHAPCCVLQGRGGDTV